MRMFLLPLSVLALAASALAAPVSLFDGKSFEGWEGDTEKTWRIEDGAIVGGSLKEKVPRNEFLATKKSFKNFDLKLKFKLVGTEGFVNSGVQYRSVRIPKPPNEMRGYQADIGDPKWWGCIYDESRRNKVMAQSDMSKIEPVLKRQDWNDYRIRAIGPRVQIWINGVQTVDYTEEDPSIPQDGHIAVQIHGGGVAEAWFKEIQIEELPDGAAADPNTAADAKPDNGPREPIDREKPPGNVNKSSSARTPATPAGVPVKGPGGRDISYNADSAAPRTAQEEAAGFRLPDGFVAELVADETVMGKAVAFNFDNAGRMWVTTANEYPLDANEQPEAAERLYREGGTDAVLIFETPWAPGLQKPRVFAGIPPSIKSTPSTKSIGLAMPMGVLPYKDGAIIQHGPDLLFLRDTDGDGAADTKEVLLTGFGIQDSHLMPHGFTRGPGDWIYFAQGAFNTSHVKTKEGPVVTAKHCKLMRMKPDGSQFEIVGWGLNNIWGFVIDPRGEMWVQEANDLGYPVAPFQLGMAYPGIGSDKPKPYAPFMPKPRTLNDCSMGGTGLSGLALNEDPETWPAPLTGAFMVANPITNKIQAIRVHREVVGRVSSRAGEAADSQASTVTSAEGTASETRKLLPLHEASPRSYDDVVLEKLPDFLVSDDKCFRPVAIQFGPDGSLYVIDWYNKIISHNEVPRTHPERDKTRSRIWRIRSVGASAVVPSTAPSSTARRMAANGREVPDLRAAADHELVNHLASTNQWQANAARFEIIDRPARNIAQQMLSLAQSQRTTTTLLQLEWLDFLRYVQAPIELSPMSDRWLRPWILDRYGAADFGSFEADVLRLRGRWWPKTGETGRPLDELDLPSAAAMLRALTRFEDPKALRWLGILTPDAQRDISEEPADEHRAQVMARISYLRQIARERLESSPAEVAGFLDSLESKHLPSIFYIALPPEQGAPRLARAIRTAERDPSAEELELLASNLEEATVREVFSELLQGASGRHSALTALQQVEPVRTPEFAKQVEQAARTLVAAERSERARILLIRLAKKHRITELEPDVAASLETGLTDAQDRLDALRTLAELGSRRVTLFHRLLRTTPETNDGEKLRREAIAALASARDNRTVSLVADLWPSLPAHLRKVALDKLTSSKTHASELVQLLRNNGPITVEDLDDPTFEKLTIVLGEDHPDVSSLLSSVEGGMQPVLRLNGNKSDVVETGFDLTGPFTVEAWVKLNDGISNEDVLLGSPAGPNFNFYDGRLRVYAAGATHDALVARTKMRPDVWTHVAITRDSQGRFRIYLNGELDAEGGKPWPHPFEKMDIGRNSLAKGTSMALTELRVWTACRTSEEIRDYHQRSLRDESAPSTLQFAVLAATNGKGAYIQLLGNPNRDLAAKFLSRSRDVPRLLTGTEARARDAKFARYRALAAQQGDATAGATIFASACGACHKVKGAGGQIGPDLSGAGAMGTESLLRNILTPNAQLESGYYRYDIELKNGDLVSGFLVKEEAQDLVIRPLASEDRVLPRENIRRTRVSRSSLMPEGLLDGMSDQSVRDLFTYLQSLK